jgi:hypothetical protein
VGDSSETVDVSASDLQVNTIQATVQGVLTSTQIANLPVNGRNFLDLAQLEPGVQIQDGQNFDPTKAGYSSISFGGRRHRNAGGAGIGGIGSLWDRRGVSMASESREAAGSSGPLLRRHWHRHRHRIVAQFFAHRSCQGPLLVGHSQWLSRSASNGSDHDDGIQSESNGKVCHSGLSQMGRMVCHNGHVLCLLGRGAQLEGLMKWQSGQANDTLSW